MNQPVSNSNGKSFCFDLLISFSKQLLNSLSSFLHEKQYKTVQISNNNIKVAMKWNLFLFSIKTYLVKYAFPKFELSGIKKNDFTSLQSWAFCLPKMVREMGWVNPKISRCDVTLVPNLTLHNQSFFSARSVNGRKMLSDSEMSDLSERSSNTE